MYRVNYNMVGFVFDEYFDNYTDAKSFAKDMEAVGFQTWLMEVK